MKLVFIPFLKNLLQVRHYVYLLPTAHLGLTGDEKSGEGSGGGVETTKYSVSHTPSVMLPKQPTWFQASRKPEEKEKKRRKEGKGKREEEEGAEAEAEG